MRFSTANRGVTTGAAVVEDVANFTICLVFGLFIVNFVWLLPSLFSIGTTFVLRIFFFNSTSLRLARLSAVDLLVAVVIFLIADEVDTTDCMDGFDAAEAAAAAPAAVGDRKYFCTLCTSSREKEIGRSRLFGYIESP
jgi:hypothetical protein